MDLEVLAQLLDNASEAEKKCLILGDKRQVFCVEKYFIDPETGIIGINYFSDTENYDRDSSESPYATFIYHLGVALESRKIDVVLKMLKSWQLSESPVKRALDITQITWVCALHDALVYFHGRGTESSFDISELEFFDMGSRISYELYRYIITGLYKIIFTEQKNPEELHRGTGIYIKSMLTCVRTLISKTDITSLELDLPSIYKANWTIDKFKKYFMFGFSVTVLAVILVIAMAFNSSLNLVCIATSLLAFILLASGVYMYEKRLKSLKIYNYALDDWLTRNFIESEGSEVLSTLKGDNYDLSAESR